MTTASQLGLPEPSRELARLTADMDRHGYCILENAIPADTVTAIRERLSEQAEAERRLGLNRLDDLQDEDDGNQWVYMLINKGQVFQELLAAPPARQVVGHVLGASYLLSDFSASIAHPSNKQMGLHTDQWWMPVPREPHEPYVRAGSIDRNNVTYGPPATAAGAISPPMVCNVLWMISDFTAENGATRLVPGSHMSGRQPIRGGPVDTVSATGRAGSAVIFEGRTWHAADFNRSDAPRYAVTTYFCAPQCRQMINFTYGTRKNVVEALSDDLKVLLGFRPWRGYGATGDHGAEWIVSGEATVGELRV